MMKKFSFFIVILIGIFIAPNTSLAKINSYEIVSNFGIVDQIILHVDGFLPVGTVCNIRPESSGVSFNNSSDLYNVVINDVHVFGGASVGNKENSGWKVVGSCSDTTINLWTLWFSNLTVRSVAQDNLNGPYVVTVGNSTMSVVDTVTVYTKDIWECGNWTSCSVGGSQTRTCNLVADSPSENIPSPATSQSCAPPCTAASWSCADWNQCSADGSQTRACNKTNCQGGIASPETAQSCVFIPPTCTSWTYSDWSSCSSGGNQTRSINSSSPNSCIGGSPVLSQSCNYVPACTLTDWSCSNWDACSQNGNQSRTCDKISNCQGGVASPATSQSCTYVAPVPSCTSFNYSSWSECASDGKQTRSITSKNPYNCEGGELPKTTQSCAYAPPCDADTWTCGDWNSCSLSGIQNRSCRKVFDCLDVQTAPPITDQYCEAPNRPVQQVPQDGSEVISNQEVIIKSTVKLLCPVDTQKASQGSGTIIDSSGTILTNKHVVAGTLGCLIGFISDFNDEPYFGERHIADILKVSPDQDIAILKIRNPQNKTLPNIDIARGSNNLRLGAKITTYGFPAKFGTKVTYTSGDFSGTDGTYIKTTAILEYGNSGGGAYLKDGTFIGIPSAVVRGELNALGYILSINTINAWLGNSIITYGDTSNNQYSRVSILEDIDLNKLGALKLFIPDTDTKGNFIAPATNQSVQKTTEQPKNNQPQKESTVIESADKSPKIKQEQNKLVSPKNEFIEKQGKENKKENGNNADTEVLEQRRSLVAETVQEIVKIVDSNIGIGQQVKVIAQTQVQNQEKLEISMKKIQNRSGLAKFFVGSDYGEIKSSQELLEQNKKQIKNLKQLGIQLSKKDDQQQMAEQIKFLEQVNQQMETSLNEAKKGFSLFGWAFRNFAK